MFHPDRGSTQPIGSMPSSDVGETRQLHNNASICMVCWLAATIIVFWPAMAKKIEDQAAMRSLAKEKKGRRLRCMTSLNVLENT